MKMTDAAKEARRAYKREWARNHPESVRRTQAKYWEKKAEELARQKAAESEQEGSAREM